MRRQRIWRPPGRAGAGRWPGLWSLDGERRRPAACQCPGKALPGLLDLWAVATTSPSFGIDVPCTKAAVSYVNPFRFAVRPERHGALVCTLPGFAGAADHPAGRSATDRRRSWSVASVLLPPHPDASTAVAVSTASAVTRARRGRCPVVSAGDVTALFAALVPGRPGSDGDAAHGGVAAGQQHDREAGEQAGQPGDGQRGEEVADAGQSRATPMISRTAASARA